MTQNHGKIRDQDVEEVVRRGEMVTVRLTHVPSGTIVQATDVDDLLARYKAWLNLRDKLEGLV